LFTKRDQFSRIQPWSSDCHLQAQEIHKHFGNQIKINMTLSAPCIGPIDKLSERDLWIPRNVQSAIITQSAEEDRVLFKELISANYSLTQITQQ
jgi:hypothetical protein